MTGPFVFPVPGSMIEAFCRLAVWGFKKQSINHSLWHALKKAPAGTGAFSTAMESKLRADQVKQQRPVCLKKGQRLGLFGRHPAEGLPVVGGRLPGKFGDMEEMEPHRTEIVIVLNRAPELRVADGQGQFLSEFAGKGRFQRLAGFDLSAGEFPKTGLRVTFRALCREKRAAAPQDAAHHFDSCLPFHLPPLKNKAVP